MRTRLVRIGNSRGVRIPKVMIEEAGLTEAVELVVRDGAIVIRSAAAPRAGWEEAARQAHARGEDRLVAPTPPTRFDEEEWSW